MAVDKLEGAFPNSHDTVFAECLSPKAIYKEISHSLVDSRVVPQKKSRTRDTGSHIERLKAP
ncbi:MAG: hypothetical protein Q9190_007267 [Brigantiaea leucoxantha]